MNAVELFALLKKRRVYLCEFFPPNCALVISYDGSNILFGWGLRALTSPIGFCEGSRKPAKNVAVARVAPMRGRQKCQQRCWLDGGLFLVLDIQNAVKGRNNLFARARKNMYLYHVQTDTNSQSQSQPNAAARPHSPGRNVNGAPGLTKERIKLQQQ